MTKSEEKIIECFFKLIKKEKIENVNISMLCKEANITRQAFYYHYQSIYDLIFSIYYDIKIESTDLSNFKKIIGDLEGFLNKFDYLNHQVINSNANLILEEYIYSYLYRSITSYFKLNKLSSDISLIRFIVSGIKEFTVNKILDKKRPIRLIEDLSEVFKNFKQINLIND